MAIVHSMLYAMEMKITSKLELCSHVSNKIKKVLNSLEDNYLNQQSLHSVTCKWKYHLMDIT